MCNKKTDPYGCLPYSYFATVRKFNDGPAARWSLLPQSNESLLQVCYSLFVCVGMEKQK